MLSHCVSNDKIQSILEQCRATSYGGHFGDQKIATTSIIQSNSS